MSLVPMVVEQTSRGERSYDIFSRLLNDRIISSDDVEKYLKLSTLGSIPYDVESMGDGENDKKKKKIKKNKKSKK